MALNPTRNLIVTHLKHLPIAFDRFINEIGSFLWALFVIRVTLWGTTDEKG